MTFEQQVLSHLKFLQEQGLDVERLEVSGETVRCHAIEDESCQGRGEYAYVCRSREMDNPKLEGLFTWCRGPGGIEDTHRTYGLKNNGSEEEIELPIDRSSVTVRESRDEVADVSDRSSQVWNSASLEGRSPYLEKKGVQAYGLRFNGQDAIVPVRDFHQNLVTLQFLKEDGSKRFLKGSKFPSCFHTLDWPRDGDDIGIAESYATAATCFEICGFPLVCAFASANLPSVGRLMRNAFPRSRIIIFADNDRHNEKNSGLESGRKARDLIGSNVILAVPDFGDIPPSADSSDWNDLERCLGREQTKDQIESLVENPQKCPLFGF